MPNQLPITHVDINIFEKVPYAVQAVFKSTGMSVPGAVISGVVLSLDNPIGTLEADPNDPTKGIFHPTQNGSCTLTATATVTVP